MSFNRIEGNNYVVGKSENKAFFCDSDFEKILTISSTKTFLKLTRLLEEDPELKTAGKEGLNLSLVGNKTFPDENNPLVFYFKLDFEGHSYFVKHSLNPKLMGSGGYVEAESTKEASEILTKNEINWAEVVKFKLGYTDKQEKYYISEWCGHNVESLEGYLQKIKSNLENPEGNNNDLTELKETQQKLIEKFKILKRLFAGYFDFREHNVLIDINTKRLYLLDLTKFVPN